MPKCKICNSTNTVHDHQTNETVCAKCGSVIEENRIVSEVSFGEAANGKAVVAGQYVSHDQSGALSNSLYGAQSGESRHQTIQKARHRLERIGHRLGVADHIIEGGLRYFRTALNYNFVKGRKSQHVLSACLYLSCRMSQTDHMLMDFAELIHINVFHIGTTFLQLTRKLKIESLPIVDPTIYIHRFVAKLHFGPEGSRKVVEDAKRLVGRMGKDWLQRGRRPAGVAAACILLAARMNNYRRSKAEIVQVAKVAEETLQRRLDEFRRTPAGTLTVHDFRHVDVESTADPPSFTRNRELERKMLERQAHDNELREQGIEPEDAYLDPEMVAIAKELDEKDGEILKLTQEVDEVLESSNMKQAAEVVAAEPRLNVKHSLSTDDEDDIDDTSSESEDEDQEEAEMAFNEAIRAGTSSIGSLTGTLKSVPIKTDGSQESLSTPIVKVSPDSPPAEFLKPAPVEPGPAASKSKASESAENKSTSARAAKSITGGSCGPARQPEVIRLTGLSASPATKQESMGRAERTLREYVRKRTERLRAQKEAEEARIAAAAKAEVIDEESLSDVDDSEIESILLNEAEIDAKSQVWLSLNHEYLLDQERKRLRREAELAAGVSRPARKRRKPRPKLEPGLSTSAEAGATSIIKERLPSKKINYAAVKELFSK